MRQWLWTFSIHNCQPMQYYQAIRIKIMCLWHNWIPNMLVTQRLTIIHHLPFTAKQVSILALLLNTIACYRVYFPYTMVECDVLNWFFLRKDPISIFNSLLTSSRLHKIYFTFSSTQPKVFRAVALWSSNSQYIHQSGHNTQLRLWTFLIQNSEISISPDLVNPYAKSGVCWPQPNQIIFAPQYFM